jgi:hypothetical protein|tara:strand:+ start:1321 stop:2043 length:723 start_codon:yes stop_codon:yes gene_type:complete
MSDLKTAMAEVNDLNSSHGVTQRGGKKYTEVFVRVEAFRKAFALDHGINTEILLDDGKRVVVKATVINAAGMIVGSGMAEEIRGSSNVNKTSALENCETSAIGRALASIGLHGGTYASLNEIDAVPRKSKAQAQQAAAPAPAPVPDAETVPLLSHTGKELKKLEHQEFSQSLIKMFGIYSTTTHDKDGNAVEPRRRMTLLKELKEHNSDTITAVGEAFGDQIEKAYLKTLRSLGAQNGSE